MVLISAAVLAQNQGEASGTNAITPPCSCAHADEGGEVDAATVAPATATPHPQPTVGYPPTPAEPLAGDCCFVATRYGGGPEFGDPPDVNYNGQPLGCPRVTHPAGRPDGLYHSADPSIMAVSPHRYDSWPCGKRVTIVNPANGAELVVYRLDACPGCGAMHVDLSEAGMAVLCGVVYPATCDYLSGLVIVEEAR